MANDDLDDELFENERDVGALRRHMRKLLSEKKALQARLRDLEAGRPRLPEGDSPRERFIRENVHRLSAFAPGSDEHRAELAKLEQEMQPLIDAEVAEHQKQADGELTQLLTDHDRIFVEQQARRLCGDFCVHGADGVLLPHVIPRLRVERKEGKPTLVVLDRGGKPTNAEALREEFREDPAFRPVIRGATDDDKAAHSRKVAEMLGEPAGGRERIMRADFDRLTPAAQAGAVKRGAVILDH